MAIEVKICGLTTPDAVAAAVDASADLYGFVFFPPSPRHVEPADAARLASALPDRARAVALTVDASDEEIDTIVETLSPGMIQMHGSETPDRVDAIARRTGLAVIKALPVAEPGDLAASAAYEDVASMLLFDARPPKGATRPGGHGVPFDWRIAGGYLGRLPWLLSGGLTPGNVAEAIHASGAVRVDVSSGIERAPGVKEPGLIHEFITSARAAASQIEERA